MPAQFSRIPDATVCRSGELVARYGGEEFVFFALATDAEGALNTAQQVCEELQAAALPHAFSTFGRMPPASVWRSWCRVKGRSLSH